MEYYPAYLPDLKDEVELIRIYGAPTVAITLNSATMTEQEVRSAALKYQEELGIPVVLPLEDGVEALVPVFEKMIRKSLAQA
jgi:uncharacterized NAD-dependent epimerase/dehydratase family protein